MSFLDKIQGAVNLQYILKAVGVVVFALTFISAWHGLSFAHKAGFFVAPALWFVGAQFAKIYK